jgi:hypothetical protein
MEEMIKLLRDSAQNNASVTGYQNIILDANAEFVRLIEYRLHIALSCAVGCQPGRR